MRVTLQEEKVFWNRQLFQENLPTAPKKTLNSVRSTLLRPMGGAFGFNSAVRPGGRFRARLHPPRPVRYSHKNIMQI